VWQSRAACRGSGRAEQRFKDFTYRTRKSWARRRRVIGKAEHLPKGSNPRFIVTSLKPSAIGGDMENRIKVMQLDLFADRTSTATMKANQLRLWFTAFAYVLVEALRRLGLRHTPFATATAGTIRDRLLKIGALVTLSVRRCLVRMARAIPIKANSRSPASGSVIGPPDQLKNAIRRRAAPRSRQMTSRSRHRNPKNARSSWRKPQMTKPDDAIRLRPSSQHEIRQTRSQRRRCCEK